MKYIFYILIILFLIGCGNNQRKNEKVTLKIADTTATKNNEIHYTNRQLEFFLDSIGRLSPTLWAKGVSFQEDSTFKNQLQMSKVISQTDLIKLKRAIKESKGIDKMIDIRTAKHIFGKFQLNKIDSFSMVEGKIPITYFSFGKKKYDFNEFAIYVGSAESLSFHWSCILYIFEGNKIIAKLNIFHRYGLELKHYKGSDGKTIIYYKENFGSGTGVLQFNYFFYKFYDNKLIPILNILANGHQIDSPPHEWSLSTSITKTTPLTLKMVYNQTLFDSAAKVGLNIVDDSTFVQYTWDERTRTLVGNYDKSKINKLQTLTYYLADNELLFINSYYATLKDCLKDKKKRHIILYNLNDIKNYYDKR